MTRSLGRIRRLAIAAAIACALPAAQGQTYTWTPIVTNGDTVPGTTAKFNSYNQPAINANGMVVFRARGKLPTGGGGGEGGGEGETLSVVTPLAAEDGGSGGSGGTGGSGSGEGMTVEGIFVRDMGLMGPLSSLAMRGSSVAQPNNLGGTYNEFPSSPRIDATSAFMVTRGQSTPVYTYVLPDTTESRVGTSGVYASTGTGLPLTGASLLGAVSEDLGGTGTYALTFPYYSVPDAPAGTRFDQFPGSPAAADGNKVAFKGNFTNPADTLGYTGVYFRDVSGDGHAATTLVASSLTTRLPNQAPEGSVKFGATAAPSAANGYVAFTGWDNEDAPTMGGVYRARMVGSPTLQTLVAIGQRVPGEAEGVTFANFGEGLSMSEDGRYVAFFATWGSEVTDKVLQCPTDGNKDRIAYCNAQPETMYGFTVHVPVHQGIFVADALTGHVDAIAKTGQDGIADFVYWTYSGAPPGTGGGSEGEIDESREPPKWRSAAFAALASKPGRFYGSMSAPSPFQVAFKATRGGVDGIYLRRGASAALETLVETFNSTGQSVDPAAPAGSIVTAVGIERDGFRHENLAIAVSMLYETVDTSIGWAGLYLTKVPALAVSKLSTAVSVASSLNPSNLGDVVTLTASVTGSVGTATGTVAFLDGSTPITGCSAVELSGGTAQCTTNALAAGVHPVTASYGGDRNYMGKGSLSLQQNVLSASGTPMNVALASSGGVATASSTLSSRYPASATINGDRTGVVFGNGGVWSDATSLAYPDWLQVQFSGPKAIDRVIVYSMQDSYATPVEPTDGMTFTAYGVEDFSVQAWNGSSWVTLGTVVGNHLVKRTVIFPLYTTDRIRVLITKAHNGYSRLAEVEAWTDGSGTGASANVALASSVNPSNLGQAVTFTANLSGSASAPTGTVSFLDGADAIPGCSAVSISAASAACTTSALGSGMHSISARYSGDSVYPAATSDALGQVVQLGSGATSTNVALAIAGATASASSTLGTRYPVSALINGDRTGAVFGNGGVWSDATAYAFPDWVQVQFAGAQTIDHVTVYSMQNNYSEPVEPSDTLTFSAYGVVDFSVQSWNGSAWVTLGTVAGNNLVKRNVAFSAVTTDRIRVLITKVANGYSRLAEVEAWTATAGGGSATNASIALASSANPSSVGQAVTFSADVSGTIGTPTGTVGFRDSSTAIAGCESVALVSGHATCTTSALAEGSHAVSARYSGDASYYAGTSGSVMQTVTGPSGSDVNVALATAGASASASSTLGTRYPVSAIIDGDRTGGVFGNGGVWSDASAYVFPDWVQIQLAGTKTISHVTVYSMQDGYTSPVDPSDTLTFRSYGVEDFSVQAWNGSAWVTLATVADNNLVKREVSFAPVSTDRIRVVISHALNGYSRLAEVEVWGH